MHDVPFQEDGVIRRPGANVHEQHAHLTLVGRKHGFGGRQLLEN